MSTDQQRADFDAFVSSHGLCTVIESDLYRSHVVGWMWLAWKAGQAASHPADPAVKESLTAAEPVKCDGNHAGPRCADPECWNDSPTGQPTPDARVTPTVELGSTPLSTQDVTPEEEEEWQRREKKK